MLYDAMFKTAFDAAASRTGSGEFVAPDETICVIASKSGRIYTGLSRKTMVGGSMTNVHAEFEALQFMLAGGENEIEALLLINTVGRNPMLPCNGCIGQIVALNPANISCQVLMYDGTIKLGDIGNYTASMGAGMNTSPLNAAPVNPSPMGNSRMFSQSMNYGNTSVNYMNASPMNASPMNALSFAQQSSMSRPVAPISTDNSRGDLLRNRVHHLMKEVDDDDDDDADFLDDEDDGDDEPKKKKRFGLFGKGK